MADKILEREYVIPLRREFLKAPRYKKSRKSITAIKEFILKHMKVEEVKVGPFLNEFVWSRGQKNPPPRVKVKTRKLKGEKKDYAQVELVDKPFQETKEEKEAKEEKKKKKGEKEEEKREEAEKTKEMTQKEEDKLLKEDKAKEILEKESGVVGAREKEQKQKTKQEEEKIRSEKIISQKQKPHKSMKK